jgi:multicomponent Na+:H+ antiporter subunit G
MDKIIVSILILLGSFFILIASVGMLRFNDLYGRLHASTKATSFGILLMLIGFSVYFNDIQVYVKALLIILFIYLTSPLAAHSISKSYKSNDKNTESNGGNDEK